MRVLNLVISIVALVVVSSCEEAPLKQPKPRMYFRIAMPPHAYDKANIDCPYTFEKPTYSYIDTIRRNRPSEHCWNDIVIPAINARIHLSYKIIHNDLATHIEDMHKLAFVHDVKADDIMAKEISNPAKKVYGLLYDITGNAASPYQFYLTDSTSKLVRGALYFDAKSVRDSLDPLVDFAKQDIDRLVETFEWK